MFERINKKMRKKKKNPNARRINGQICAYSKETAVWAHRERPLLFHAAVRVSIFTRIDLGRFDKSPKRRAMQHKNKRRSETDCSGPSISFMSVKYTNNRK